jgi:hypothetical protein
MRRKQIESDLSATYRVDDTVNMKPTISPSEPNQDKKPRERWQLRLGTYISYAITGLLILWLFQQFFLAPRMRQTSEISYSDFKQKLAGGQIVT